jgi:GTPase
VNKIDTADPLVVSRLLRTERDAVAISARTGEGLDKLRAVIEEQLPRPPVELEALVPYDHGELVSQMHRTGEVISVEHEAGGTRVRARVSEGLAAALAPYAI